MKLAFYAPFKPIGHGTPSGDLIIARSLVDFLQERGHEIIIPSQLRARWIYFKPWLWFRAIADIVKTVRLFRKARPDAWVTYHTYYKSPDVIGPLICRLTGLKYIIFQGIYSTKRRRRFKTVFGFYLNRHALRSADHVFTNKRADLENLTRIIPADQLTYIRLGIRPKQFKKDAEKGADVKKRMSLPDRPIILTAAMFRDDVKTRGLTWLIKCLAGPVLKDVAFHLVIAGAGKMEAVLKDLARQLLPEKHTFAGKIPREQMDGFYSAGDLFAFPGIRESLGMVFLEAQSCSLPVVAFDNGGIPEVVQRNTTGFLVPMYDEDAFALCVRRLISKPDLSRNTGRLASSYVAREHDIEINYKRFESVLKRVVFP